MVLALAVMANPWFALAQTDQPPPPQPPQIDLTVVNVPTTLSLKARHSYFRLTHRFARDLRRGSFGQLAEDLFSLDNGAVIGLLDKRNTFFLGLGARVRFLSSAFLVGEVSPRLAGYSPDRAAWNVGIEKLTHGHVLQLNFGNNFSTTPGMVARGGDEHSVFMGFNLSRKF